MESVEIQNPFLRMMRQMSPRPRDHGQLFGDSPQAEGRVFGGQVLAQSLLAGYLSVPDTLVAHSMHAYFLRGGDPQLPIKFDVEILRDGRSFSTRQVIASQNGKAIFSAAISFHIREEGLSHQEAMPEILDPEHCEVLNPIDKEGLTLNQRYRLLDLFHIELRTASKGATQTGGAHKASWFRIRGRMPTENIQLQQAALAMLSDYTLLSAAFVAHEGDLFDGKFNAASLDHAIWFHNPPDLNDFVLYTSESPWSDNARGFSRGELWSRRGKLLASTAQEGLMRLGQPR
ncbi:acyl-CoA thioesterase II [Luminiphilus syltensis NOR5-1B]|uniref:Acyl-CoA thioesterase II n=2 Tax=Luminiphilus TaxID=1341118 RepID=B8KWV7_9GAMM|nr:acyl-CoA thioesterase II [Luminiphilus syltensis NOR5-1B]